MKGGGLFPQAYEKPSALKINCFNNFKLFEFVCLLPFVFLFVWVWDFFAQVKPFITDPVQRVTKYQRRVKTQLFPVFLIS